MHSNLTHQFNDISNRILRRSKNVPEIPRICQECLLCDLHKLPYLALENAAASPGQPAGVIGARWSQRTSPGIPISGTEWNELVALYKRHVPEHPRPLPIVLEENGNLINFVHFLSKAFHSVKKPDHFALKLARKHFVSRSILCVLRLLPL